MGVTTIMLVTGILMTLTGLGRPSTDTVQVYTEMDTKLVLTHQMQAGRSSRSGGRSLRWF